MTVNPRMPVKHWSFAGLMVTAWCNARCACCYLGCSPLAAGEMTVEQALTWWEQLIQASPHGCRIHLTGGEPFGDWPRLITLCQQARRQRLGPLQKVETNAFWAADRQVIHDRLTALAEAGMQKLAISADPYHQQFVPIERCRLLAQVAGDLLGAAAVQVRWQDWLRDGFDTDGLEEAQRRNLFTRYASQGRERLGGRAAQTIAPYMQLKPLGEFVDVCCEEALLRGRHVHVVPDGTIVPGTCAGIALGRLGPAESQSAKALWQQLHQTHASRPVISILARSGPYGLMKWARQAGFEPREAYAGKCHLCWEVRKFLHGARLGGPELGPDWLYEQ